jgi:hypothetical protein
VASSFIWTNLNPLPPRMICVKSNQNWPCGSGEQDLSITPSHFFNYLPCEEDLAFYLNKIESPSPKDNLYQVWPAGSGKKTSKHFQCIFTLSLLSSLGEGQSPFIWTNLKPLPLEMIFAKWSKLAQWFWRKSKNVKVLLTDGRTADNLRSE